MTTTGPTTTQALTTPRLRGLAALGVTAVALASIPGSGTPPLPPTPLPSRVRVVRAPARLRCIGRTRLVRMRRALRASRTGFRSRSAPASHSDTPALPTVGQPRSPPRFSDSEIFSSVWGCDLHRTSSTLAVYIGYLRRKLEAGGETRLIHTLPGFGFTMAELGALGPEGAG